VAGEPQQLKPVYLLTGSDRPKVLRALERLRARFGEEATAVLSAQDQSGDDAVAASNAMGLFGTSGRLVVVEHVERWKAADASAVAAYLEDPAPGNVLALLAEDLRKDAALIKTVAKHGEVLAYDVSKRDLPKWVGEQFTRLGAQADANTCRALVAVVGEDLTALSAEVEKLAAWAAGEPINEIAVELLAAPHGDAPTFAVTDAWGARDRAALLRACELALERSGDPQSSRIARIVGTLVKQVRMVTVAQRLAAEGVRPSDSCKELGDGGRPVHRFVAEKAFAHSRNYSPEELEDALVRLAALDHALKGGSRLPARLELDRTLAAIT
jgi:DNA polymerase III delta subunit